MKKSAILIFSALVLTMLMSACDDPKPAQQVKAAPKIFKFAQTNNDKHKYQLAMLKFKEIIEKKSEGRFEIEVFAGTLGGDRDLMEGLQIGSVDAAAINTSLIASVVPMFGVFDLPFLFRDRAHAYAVMDGPIGQELIKSANAKMGFVATDYWENGFRGFTNNVRPITKPQDLKNLKFRTLQSAIHLDTFKQWGANPTPMAWAEVYSAMQQNLIDGHDNAADTVNANKMWEVQKYFSDSRHFYSPVLFVMSPTMWNSLGEADKKMFLETSKEVTLYERKLAAEMYDKALDNLRKNMQVVDKVDYEAFKSSVQPIWEKYSASFGQEIIQKIADTK